MNTKDIGVRSEVCILAAFVKAGYEVLLPFGSKRYDMVIDRRSGIGFERVQCKTGRLRNGTVTYSSSSVCGKPWQPNRTYEGQIEMFAVYCPTNEAVYIIPIAETGNKELRLRITPPKNAQSRRIRWAKDYQLLPNSGHPTTTTPARRGSSGEGRCHRHARAALG